MIPDDYQDDEQGGGDYPAYLNQTQFSRPANGGNLAGSNVRIQVPAPACGFV